MPFPIHRMRRLRATESLRSLVRETRLEPSQFILPLFVCPGAGIRREIGAMPGNYQMSVDEIVKECAEVRSLGIGGVILFGLPETKDELASGAYADDGIVQRALRAIKRETPDLLVMTDVCNCEYTSHGHCGKIVDGDVDNDVTLEWLARSARFARARRRRHRGAFRHDGRPRGRHPQGARREGLREDPHPLLRRQVRLRFLRPVPRGRGIGAAVRRPPQLPDGPRQRPRSACAKSNSTSKRAPT